MRGFSIRIFVPTGEPDGLRIVEKSNWTGLGVVCPRPLLNEMKGREEFTRTGVYILSGPSDTGNLPTIYIGEAESVRPRLESHANKKDFWTTVTFFVSKDQNLNKAHVQYLESRLISKAREAKRCMLDNVVDSNEPQLSEADKADVEVFLDEVLLCLPIVGLTFFERPNKPTPVAPLFILDAKDTQATGYETTDGFVVTSGSRARGKVAPSAPHVPAIRQTLIEQGVLVLEGSHLVLSQDYEFSSPSYAAGLFLGRSANGRTEWKTAGGSTLREIQEADAEESTP